MFNVDELLSKKNQREALAHFDRKKDGCGADGMRVSELKEYWKVNSERIMQDIRRQKYEPGLIKNIEIINGKGKKRTISSLNVIDRYICRLLSQKLKRYFEPEFLSNSYAYQDNKGIMEAVECVRSYIENGMLYITEIDIRDCFDTIPIEGILSIVNDRISDSAVIALIRKFLFCKVIEDENIVEKRRGLIQGNSMSPILCNMYLHAIDAFMQEKQLNWMRFADNIYVYCKTKEESEEMFESICDFIKVNCRLQINDKKSGVYPAMERRVLGYEFYRWKGHVEARRHKYKKENRYYNWHPSAIRKIGKTYHLIQNGVLNKKDFSLIFENEEEKHDIPVEIVEQMNVYGEITISSSALRIICDKNIKLMIFDKFGNTMCSFSPEKHLHSGLVLLKQVELYLDAQRRLEMAKSFEISGLHNMISNLKYYRKKQKIDLDNEITELTGIKQKMNEAKGIDEIMLAEARARQIYYQSFNSFIKQKEFRFEKRTKRPPKDEINALISFGNTLLYGVCLHSISKSSMDPRVGVVHATNRRSNSLDLDFADLFKPVIVDRLIFSLINLMQLKVSDHFKENDDGGVYLNEEGKRIFVKSFEEKMDSVITIDNKPVNYRQLIEKEIFSFQKHLIQGAAYKPYKYR